MEKLIKEVLEESTALKKSFFSSKKEIKKIIKVVFLIKKTFKQGNKIVLFGNGGSAADAQHIAAELVGRFNKERKGFFAMSLTTNTSVLTSIANDYSYECVFSRQVEAIIKKGDMVFGLSTSGRSHNVIKGIKTAKKCGAITVGLIGGDGGKLAKIVDIPFIVPSKNTPRIQEIHITLGHLICDLVEKEMTKKI